MKSLLLTLYISSIVYGITALNSEDSDKRDAGVRSVQTVPNESLEAWALENLGPAPETTPRKRDTGPTPIPNESLDTWIAENFGTVSSSTATKRDDLDFAPLTTDQFKDWVHNHVPNAEVTDYSEESSVQKREALGESETVDDDNKSVQKRNVNTCLACMLACGVNMRGGNPALVTKALKVSYCLYQCVAQGACSGTAQGGAMGGDESNYRDRLPNMFPDEIPALANPGPNGYNLANWGALPVRGELKE